MKARDWPAWQASGVEGVEAATMDFPGEIGGIEASPGGGTHLGELVAVGQEGEDSLAESVGVAGFDDATGLLGYDKLGGEADSRGDGGQAVGGGFDDGCAEVLDGCGRDIEVGIEHMS